MPSVQGEWRIVEMPDYEPDFPDMTSCLASRAMSSPPDGPPIIHAPCNIDTAAGAAHSAGVN